MTDNHPPDALPPRHRRPPRRSARHEQNTNKNQIKTERNPTGTISSYKQKGYLDRYARPGLSQHGARPRTGVYRPAPQRPALSAEEVRASLPPRMTPNPRLAREKPPVIHPPRLPAVRPADGRPDGAKRTLSRRRFSSNRPIDTKPGIVAAIQKEAAENPVEQVVLSSGSRKLRIIPLGGAGEVGSKNMTVFEYGDDIVVIDCGIAFAGPDYPGVDALIPDVSYLEARKKSVRGLIITHGHLDHIGAIPYIWPKLNCPIYAAPLSGGLIEHSLAEAGITNAPITTINPGDKLHFGKLSVEMVRLTHSIPDVLGLAIRCPAGLFFYATDWRLEHRPVLGKPADWTRIASLAGEGITALFSDSTNVIYEGYTPSEVVIGETFDKIFGDAVGRIIIAQFASNINRVQQVMNSCVKFHRRLALSGRSMNTYINIAMKLGYLSVPEGLLVDLKKIGTIEASRLVILSTGSQGEEFSSMTRIASGEHRDVKLDPSDTVIMSASTVPGNETAVARVLDNLYHEGVKVINNRLLSDVHVTGHPNREELRLMISICGPRYFIPIHGDFFRLVEHGKIAVQQGVPGENVFYMENGQVVEFDDRGGRMTSERVPLEDIMIDGLGVGDVGPVVIRDRLAMGKEGIVTVFMVVDKNGQMLTSPDIITRGFVYVKESEALMRQLRDEVKKSYAGAVAKFGQKLDEVKDFVRDDVQVFISQNTARNPMVIPVITRVGDKR